MSRTTRFQQPVSAMMIVSQVTGPRTLLTDEAIRAGQARVAAGEDPDAVAADLAAEELALVEEWGSGPLRTLKGRTKEGALHAAADLVEVSLKAAVAYAFAAGLKAVNKSALRAAKNEEDAMVAMDYVPGAVRNALLKSLPLPLARAYDGGRLVGTANLGVKALAGPLGGKLGGVANSRAAKWAKEHAAELAEGLSETSRKDIAAAISDAFEGEGGMREAYDEILEAVGDASRADLIGRTEAMQAAAEGQRGAWADAVESGLLSGDEKREWIATAGCCDECDELDGEQTGLDGSYPGDGGDGPPLHPNCRCTEGIVG